MSVVHAICGAPTPDGATFVAQVDGGGPVRVAASTDSAMTSPVFTASQAVDAQGVAKVSITGLDPATQHHWQVEDNGVLDTSVTGRFRTAPPAGTAASFTFAAAGDAGAGDSGFVVDRVSNHPVFDTIREADPAFFVHMGDYHYRDIGDGDHTPAPFDETDYRDAFDDMLTYNGVEGTAARQQHLYREVPLVPTWDNHDYGFSTASNVDSDRTLPHRAAARTVFQEQMPHYPLAAGSGDVPIYYSFTYGRVLFVVLDVRSERDSNSDPDDAGKTMLGSAQKAWLDGLLATSDAKALCIVSAGQWLTVEAESDTWQVYQTEQQELVDMFRDRGWLHRMWMLTASKHALGLDSGAGNSFGGFPVALFASLDTNGAEVQQGLYDQGPTQPGGGQYGQVTITDLGSAIAVKLAGWHYQDGLWGEIQFGINVPTEPTVAPGAVLRTLSGAHKATFEARVVTEFQTSDDPTGTKLPISGGDVEFDGTAKIRGNLQLAIPGIDEQNGQSRWPRRPSDLISPYGHEVFVRRGVDIGPEILWTPLGYYRIQAPEQDDAPDGAIRIMGLDRMAGIVDGRLLEPREYDADQTVSAVVADLVTEIYPEAVIAFDSGGSDPLGRQVIAEESRYEALWDIVTSLGKIVYWDGTGILRIETAPEEDEPVWEVAAGADGVLLTASRRLTREGIYNAVVAEGEGTDAANPVRAVAFDSGPNSPTRFGGPFGRVPRFYSSPLLTTITEASAAAQSLLRRSLGAPYSVDFGAVVNPTLRPYDPVRITLRDGTREVHVMERVRIPLRAEVHMTGATREKTVIAVGTLS